MALPWQSYPVEFTGGLITNVSPLQQGVNAPGSARILRNFEPSIEGGYRRIKGYEKYDTDLIPPYGAPVVHGGSQSGTTLIIAAIHKTPEAGDTLTIDGVNGTYTIASSGVTYDSVNNRATLTLTTSLDSSPSNAADVTFTSTASDYLALGVCVFTAEEVIVAKNNDLHVTRSNGYTKVNVPNYGTTVLVNGASQTGSSLAIDGLTSAPKTGDVFKIAGVDLVYTVTADASLSSGGATISINPALDSSPADDAAITFLSTSRENALKTRFFKYNYSNIDKLIIVDGYNAPATWDGTNFTVIHDAPADIVGSTYVVDFKNHLFFAKNNVLSFGSYYSDSDFTIASGGGNISLPHDITGLMPFRDQLIIFTTNSIHYLMGTNVADWQLKPISVDLGCPNEDTIQEVSGDIMFLAQDGFRLLSGTDRIGDFSLGVVSKNIQTEINNFKKINTSYSSMVIRQKSQYRAYGYNTGTSFEDANGILGTQMSPESGETMAWAELRGIKSYVCDSKMYSDEEMAVFANYDGYLYQLEESNSFDGNDIPARIATPFLIIDDPNTRKTFYKTTIYTDPSGSVKFDASLRFDFDEKDIIQPEKISIDNRTGVSGSVAFYGLAKYGESTAIYSGKPEKVFSTNLIGSGFAASVQIESVSSDPPYSLDALTLEYSNNTRR